MGFLSLVIWIAICSLNGSGTLSFLIVVLLVDKHESHISIEVIQLARANIIEILGFSAHTTHILVLRCVN
jgi:hypothetical protein